MPVRPLKGDADGKWTWTSTWPRLHWTTPPRYITLCNRYSIQSSPCRLIALCSRFGEHWAWLWPGRLYCTWLSQRPLSRGNCLLTSCLRMGVTWFHAAALGTTTISQLFMADAVSVRLVMTPYVLTWKEATHPPSPSSRSTRRRLTMRSPCPRHLEANLFIICGSAPTLRKFFQHFAPRLVGSSRKSSRTAYRKNRSGYREFRDPVELGVLANRAGSDTDGNAHARATVEACIGGVGSDDHNDGAILETRTYDVEYTNKSL